MIRALTAFVLLLCSGWAAFSQDRAMQNAARNGRPLAIEITVKGPVTAQAVLIPRIDARRIFGNEIANNYAVIEINVGNKSPDAALIIHGVFIDYTRWALSGTPGTSIGLNGRPLTAEPFQANTNPNQVASEEYRVVRGQLLDAQMWSKRNWTMRLLTLAGSLASAYAFSINEEGIVRGLNAFSGSVVPGIREAWPDGTVEQLNRISDFGYQTNKVIPKQAAEVIVCFFPIDRFLTPGFKKLFLRSPALFFAPLQMLVDPTMKKETEQILKSISPNLTVQNLKELMPCYNQVVRSLHGDENTEDTESFGHQVIQNALSSCETRFGLASSIDQGKRKVTVTNPTIFDQFLALDFISQMSLNTVSVVVEGAMTVDVTTIPGRLDAVTFDRVTNCGGPSEPCFWAALDAANGARTGIIPGSYLTGGNIVIEEASALGITDIKTISEASNDQELHFSFKLTKPIPPDTKLHFRISKPNGTKPVESLSREVAVGYTITAPAITEVKRTGNKLTVTGSGFYDVLPTFPLVVKIQGPSGPAEEVKPDSATSKELKLTIPGEVKPTDCWKVFVSVGVFLAMPKSSCDH